MGFRDYNPGINRFLSRDMYTGALADLNLQLSPWTNNRYAFTGGNPITGIELDGHVISDFEERYNQDVANGVDPAGAGYCGDGSIYMCGATYLDSVRATDEYFENANPADTTDIIGRFPLSGREDVERAVTSAKRGFDRWKRTPAPERSSADSSRKPPEFSYMPLNRAATLGVIG